MTIEIGPAHVPEKAASAANGTAAAKGKPGANAKADTPAAGGFMAILASLDAQSEAGAPVAATGAVAANDEALVSTAGGSLPADSLLVAATGALDTTVADVKPEVPFDAVAFLAQTAQWSSVQTPAAGTGGLDGSGGPAIARPSRAAPIQAGVPVSQAGLGGVGSEPAHKTGKGPFDFALKRAPADVDLSGASVTSGQIDPKALPASEREVEAKSAPLAVAQAQALSLAEAVVPAKRQEQLQERSIFKSGAFDGPLGAQLQVSTPSNPSPLATSADVSPAQAYIADQVSYWISNDVQNAELKLDGMGDQPVEVSIRMQGNEAHIVFRTDEQQTREVLQNASLHLKEMLQREGVVLSGVSVGTSGAGDSGGKDRQPRQGARQVSIASMQPLVGESRAVLSGASKRAVDLFV